MRPEDGRDARLLGLQRLRPEHAPQGTFTQVAAGNGHTCGLKTDGTLACWGRNDYGQSTPADGTFTQVATGYDHTCGLKTDGTLACWGGNDYGQSTPPAGANSAAGS